MYQINQITNDPVQTQNLLLPDGTQIILGLQFTQQQYGWFFTSVEYDTDDFLLQGIRVCNSPNMLHQWRNLIPFGIACYSPSNREPQFLQDFVSGNSVLYILTAAEVAAYAEFLSGG